MTFNSTKDPALLPFRLHIELKIVKKQSPTSISVLNNPTMIYMPQKKQKKNKRKNKQNNQSMFFADRYSRHHISICDHFCLPRLVEDAI